MNMGVSTLVTVQQAVADIEAHLGKYGGPHRAWYCGVATDPEARLFQDHNVSRTNNAWIYRGLMTDTESRQVEAHFLKKGCDGGPGGGDRTSRYVYAYKKTASTRP
jgi:hypothetical protein